MSTTLKPQDVLKMLREARKMPKNSSIINICGRPAPVSGVAALPTLYELEHGPAPPRAAVTTLPVRPAATSTPKPAGTPTKATATKATATKTTTANTTAARTTTTAAKATATATKPTAKKAAAKKTAGTDTQTSNAGN